jgi:hypothetical protein
VVGRAGGVAARRERQGVSGGGRCGPAAGTIAWSLMEMSERSVGDDLYVLRCTLPPSRGDPTGERYVRSYGLYKRGGLHLTDVVEAALRVTAGDAPTLSAEIRDRFGLVVEPHVV